MRPVGASAAVVERGPREELLAERLFPPEPGEIRWGLGRTRAMLSELGDPHLDFAAMHVGGTNGKGSVAAIWSSVLRSRGLRVGLYTSPHLLSLRERFQIDGTPLSEEVLAGAADEIRPVLERWRPSHFEAGTVLAFHLFRKYAVDVAVVEVGLGGRLDATNVLRPEVSAITSVALDHAAYLGSSLSEVAREKAGILKPDVPAVVGETRSRIRPIFEQAARDSRAPLHFVRPRGGLRAPPGPPGRTTLRIDTEAWGQVDLTSSLVGPHQAANVRVAVRALELLPLWLRPDREALQAGIAAASLPGRFQVLEAEGRTWILDVAHNPAAVRALIRTLRAYRPSRPVVLLAGILGDKAWTKMLHRLLGEVDRAVLTQPPSAPLHRRWDLEAAGRMVSPVPLEVVATFHDAVAAAAREPGGTVLTTGSFPVVADAIRALGPAALPPFRALL